MILERSYRSKQKAAVGSGAQRSKPHRDYHGGTGQFGQGSGCLDICQGNPNPMKTWEFCVPRTPKSLKFLKGKNETTIMSLSLPKPKKGASFCPSKSG